MNIDYVMQSFGIVNLYLSLSLSELSKVLWNDKSRQTKLKTKSVVISLIYYIDWKLFQS